MAQTKAGALKTSAQKAGLTVDEYQARLESGLKRCTRCKAWKPLTEFGRDRTRSDGHDASCFECRRVKTPRTTKGRESTFKGHKHTDKAKQLMSLAKRGKPSNRLGVPHTSESREKISQATRERTNRGRDHYNYKHGLSQRNLSVRRSPEYSDWRNAVFARDSFTCQKCGDATGGNLRAHHIKPFAEYPELRFDLANGITLCHKCHELEHFKPDSIRNLRKAKRGNRLW